MLVDAARLLQIDWPRAAAADTAVVVAVAAPEPITLLRLFPLLMPQLLLLFV